MSAILSNSAKQYEQIIDTPLKKRSMQKLVKISEVVSEKKTFKDYTSFTCI